jgi:hypothetical protein
MKITGRSLFDFRLALVSMEIFPKMATLLTQFKTIELPETLFAAQRYLVV